MDKNKIGLNAGTVWHLLSDQRKWSYRELKEASGLPDCELNAAIGWLARENKIDIERDAESDTELFSLQFNMYF